jgi:hypothetical protein
MVTKNIDKLSKKTKAKLGLKQAFIMMVASVLTYVGINFLGFEIPQEISVGTAPFVAALVYKLLRLKNK